MASITSAIITYLGTIPAITALVGNRIFPVVLPQNPTYPSIVHQRISTPRVMSHQGYSNLALPRFQFTIFAQTYLSYRSVADQLRLALIGFRGTLSGIRVDAILLIDERSNYNPVTQIFEPSLDFVIHHNEA